MDGRISNDLGEIRIDQEVVARAAGLTALECYGIVGMTSTTVTDGIVNILKKENLTKGVIIDFVENKINITFHIVVEYGVNIAAVTDTLISTVQYKIEKFTGIKIGEIVIYVEGVRVDEIN
ncbi:MAG: Asp23/Gls24 family envelope stress response protein [Vallitaleaceae bacterium]|nr:Asp23/Gls24 family envelope stress response protein [Vallitaleaceae bacterium]